MKIKMMGWVLKQVHQTDRSFIPLQCLKTLTELLSIYVPLLLMAPIIRSAIAKEWQALLLLVFALLGLRTALNYTTQVLSQIAYHRGVRVDDLYRNKLYLHAADVDFVSFQDTDHKSSFQRALESLNYQGSFLTLLQKIFTVIGAGLSAMVSIGITVALLTSQPTRGGWAGTVANPWVSSSISIIVLAVLFTIVFYGMQRFAKKARIFHEDHIDVERRIMYLVTHILFAPKHFALFQTYDMFRVLDRKLYKELDNNMEYFNVAVRNMRRTNLLQGAIGTLLIVMAYSIAGIKVMAGAIPLAMLVTFAESFAQLTVSSAQLTQTVVELVNMLPYQKDIRDYYERDHLFHTGTIPVEKRSDHEVLLSMENVSFKYPGSDEWVLRDVNVTLDMKQKHAIVGPNGAGKTTFILLLCRLFEPTEGRILLNGVDIRKYDYEEYLSLFSVVFQDFQLFAFTLGENVGCGTEYDAERVRHDLIRSGFGSVLEKLDREGDALDATVMSAQRDKVHFSGGEQQKIAIARALYRNGPVMILDEPTAALDPISEAEIYAHLNDLIEDKTTVFISHRMSSCRFCSDIIVFDEGRVVERGSHESLLRNKALYHDMWHAQAEYYQ